MRDVLVDDQCADVAAGHAAFATGWVVVTTMVAPLATTCRRMLMPYLHGGAGLVRWTQAVGHLRHRDTVMCQPCRRTNVLGAAADKQAQPHDHERNAGAGQQISANVEHTQATYDQALTNGK